MFEKKSCQGWGEGLGEGDGEGFRVGSTPRAELKFRLVVAEEDFSVNKFWWKNGMPPGTLKYPPKYRNPAKSPRTRLRKTNIETSMKVWFICNTSFFFQVGGVRPFTCQ